MNRPSAVATLKRRSCLLLAALVLGACAVAPRQPPAPTTPPAENTEAWYRAAEAAGQAVWQIDPARSLITIVVRRGGALARLGHDHVVASHDIHGLVAPQAGRADFQFRLDALTVDEPALRRAAGLEHDPTPDAIEGTRHNMLTTVLDADHYPLAAMRVDGRVGNLLHLSISLHGVIRSMDLPVQLEQTGNTLTASGSLALRQSDFAIAPMSVLGGAISVQDQLALQFHLVASPVVSAR
jgi:hypothetical protein